METSQTGQSDSPASELTRIRNLLKRSVYLVAANWQLVVVQFVAESTFKLLLAVPIAGGAVLVAVAAGRDLTDLLHGEWREVLARIAGALMSQPLALVAFATSFLVVLLGGSTLMFLVKGGTTRVLVDAELSAGAIERPPIRMASFKRAARFSVDSFLDGSTSLFRRYLTLGFGLLGVYAISGAAYLAVVVEGYRIIDDSGRLAIVAALLATWLIVWITLVNVFYLLTQMVIAVDDVTVGEGCRRAIRFVRGTLRPMAVTFGILLALVVLASVASILATAALGLISFVPFVGLAVLPLQVVAWLVRGVVFQYLGLTAFGAYLALYRMHRARSAEPLSSPTWIRTA